MTAQFNPQKNQSLRGIKRRSLLPGLALLGVAGSAFGAGATAPPASRLATYRKLRGGFAGESAVWWSSGVLWGKRSHDHAFILLRVEGLNFLRFDEAENGGARQIMQEAAIWRGPEGGPPIQAWTNPLNGLPCTPPHFTRTQVIDFTSTGSARRSPTIDASFVKYVGGIAEPQILGDTIWQAMALVTKIAVAERKPDEDPLAHPGPVRSQTHSLTLQSQVRHLSAEAHEFTPATIALQSLDTWPAWMRMGPADGEVMLQVSSKKLERVEKAPESFLADLRTHHPGWIERRGE